MTAPTFDHENVRSVDEIPRLPSPFHIDRDTGELPEGCERLDHMSHGARVVDVTGERFLLMGYGAVQGTVTLRDRGRRLFYAEGDLIMREVKQ